MKLTDFLEGVGRPVAYYPGLARALHDAKEAIFVCQMFYWKDKGNDPDGWIYKNSWDIEEETGLTYKEQINVRKGLRKKNLLQERYARTEHQMYYRVDWEALNELFAKHLTDGHMLAKHLPKGQVASSQRSDGSLPNVSSLNSNSESTQKITPERGAANAAEPPSFENASSMRKSTATNDVVNTHTGINAMPADVRETICAVMDFTGLNPKPRDLPLWRKGARELNEQMDGHNRRAVIEAAVIASASGKMAVTIAHPLALKKFVIAEVGRLNLQKRDQAERKPNLALGIPSGLDLGSMPKLPTEHDVLSIVQEQGWDPLNIPSDEFWSIWRSRVEEVEVVA